MKPQIYSYVGCTSRVQVLGPRYTKPGLLEEKKTPSSPSIQKEYSDDGLSGYTVSTLKAVRRRCILFVFMVSSVFFPPAVVAYYILGLNLLLNLTLNLNNRSVSMIPVNPTIVALFIRCKDPVSFNFYHTVVVPVTKIVKSC